MTEQRYRAVLEVEAGVPMTEVAKRFGASRQAVHRWIGWYRDEGLANSCSPQDAGMPPGRSQAVRYRPEMTTTHNRCPAILPG
jgi:transposase